jgi:3-methyladenine DNA glycosylase AlkD
VRKETERLVDLVKKNGSPEDAPHAQKYIKTKFEVLGVRMPTLDSIAKEFYSAHKTDENLIEVHIVVNELWSVPIYDVKTLAISILRRFRRKLDRTTFDTVKGWWDDLDNWAHCDGTSVYVLGSILLKDDSVISDIMEWTKSDNQWKRRAALTSTMLGNRVGKGDPFWTLTMLNDVLDDKEYYVHDVQQVQVQQDGCEGSSEASASREGRDGNRIRLLQMIVTISQRLLFMYDVYKFRW